MTSDQLDLKITRLAAGLAADLDGTDDVHFPKRAPREQREQLIVEALTEAVRLANEVLRPEPCRVPFCEVVHTGPTIPSRRPDSLIDRGA